MSGDQSKKLKFVRSEVCLWGKYLLASEVCRGQATEIPGSFAFDLMDDGLQQKEKRDGAA